MTVQAAKLRRCEERTTQCRQNRLFECKKKRLELEGIERTIDVIPDAEGCRNIWGGIYEKDVKHKSEAEWLQDLKNELGDLEKEGEAKISGPMIKNS